MRAKFGKRGAILEYGIVAVICAAILLFAFYIKGMQPFGSKTHIGFDGYQQNAPAVYYIYDVLHGEASPYFSWNIAFGGNMSGVLYHFGLMSPLNLLLFAVPRNQIENCFWWMAVVRCVLLGMSMLYAVRRMTENRLGLGLKIVCACGYAFSSYAMQYLSFPQWLDAGIYFPLYAASLMDLIQYGKKRGCVIAQTLVLLLNLQQAFQFALFTLAGFYLLTFCLKRDDRAARRNAVKDLALATLLSLCLSAAFLLPGIKATLTSGRVGGSFSSSISSIFSGTAPSEYQADKNNMIFGLIVISSLCVVLAVIRLIRRKKLAPVSVFALVMALFAAMQIPFENINLLWQGGNYVFFPMRGGYILSFSVLLAFASLCAEFHHPNPTISRRRTIVVVNLVSMVLAVAMDTQVAVRFIPQSIRTETDDMMRDGVAIHDALDDAGMDRKARYKAIDASMQNNFSVTAGVCCNSNYLHLMTSDSMNANLNLGYAQTWTRLSDVGGTAFSDALLGYRYGLSASPLDERLYAPTVDTGRIQVCDLKYTWPFGTLMNTVPQYAGQNPFENQNVFSSAAVGEELLQYEQMPSDTSLWAHTMESRSAVYVWRLERTEPVTLTVNGENVMVPDYALPDNRFYPDNYGNCGCLLLGVWEAGEEVELSVQSAPPAHLFIAVLNLDRLAALQPRACVSDIQWTKTAVHFTAARRAGEGEWLFLPIGFLDDFQVRINGELHPAENAGGFMAIQLPEGVSDVTVAYKPLEIPLGLLMSGMGCAILIFCFVYRRIKGKRRQKKGPLFLYAVFALVSIGFVVVVYAFLPGVSLVHMVPEWIEDLKPFYFTDAYWTNGYSNYYAGFYVRNSEQARSMYVENAVVSVTDGDERMVTYVREDRRRLCVYLSGAVIDGSVLGTPDALAVSPPDAGLSDAEIREAILDDCPQTPAYGRQLYALPKAYAAGGQEYLDTGVRLFEEGMDTWTLVIAYKRDFSCSEGYPATVATCIDTDNMWTSFEGLCIRRTDDSGIYNLTAGCGSVRSSDAALDGWENGTDYDVAVIRRDHDRYSMMLNGVTAYVEYGGWLEYPISAGSFDDTLLLGCSFVSAGKPKYPTQVDIPVLAVYQDVLDDQEAMKLCLMTISRLEPPEARGQKYLELIQKARDSLGMSDPFVPINDAYGTLIYALREPFVSDGAQKFRNTGVSLFGEGMDNWTLAIAYRRDFTCPEGYPATVATCIDTAHMWTDFEGFCIRRTDENEGYNITAGSGTIRSTNEEFSGGDTGTDYDIAIIRRDHDRYSFMLNGVSAYSDYGGWLEYPLTAGGFDDMLLLGCSYFTGRKPENCTAVDIPQLYVYRNTLRDDQVWNLYVDTLAALLPEEEREARAEALRSERGLGKPFEPVTDEFGKLIYALDKPFVSDGAQKFRNTGVSLFGEGMDNWTVAIAYRRDFTCPEGYPATVATCIDTAHMWTDFEGFCIRRTDENEGYNITAGSGTLRSTNEEFSGGDTGADYDIAIIRRDHDRYSFMLNGVIAYPDYGGWLGYPLTAGGFDDMLLLGCSTVSAGTPERCTAVEIPALRVYNETLDDDSAGKLYDAILSGLAKTLPAYGY